MTLRRATTLEILPLFQKHHGYGGMSSSSTYAFAVEEQGRLVAAFTWQPPPVGAARGVCPEEPSAVLALSRMVAVPRDERELRHISKPLRVQMRKLIDRGRWPVLVTFSDEGMGHTGHVYKCSGWQPTARNKRPQYERDGVRTSTYANGLHSRDGLDFIGHAFVQRWEHWACERGEVQATMALAGWHREAIPGKVWKSGNQAHRWVNG